MKREIREWRPDDARDLCKALSDAEVQKNLRDGIPYSYTEKDACEYIAAMLGANQDNIFAFAGTANDRAIGSITAFRQLNIHRYTAVLGYYIGRRYFGENGIVTRAIKQICGHIFEDSDILRIYAALFAENAASCKRWRKRDSYAMERSGRAR